MKSVLFIFFVSFLISLLATPLATKLGIRLGAVDRPSVRKVHRGTIPRSGGLAIFLSFVITLVLIKLIGTRASVMIEWDTVTKSFFSGALLIFLIGFLDDLFRLRAGYKLLFQILAATIAFAGGLQITSYYFTSVPVQSVVVSYLLTVFWFVLIINAINLIDGLDGLAGGITFFVCTILVFVLFWDKKLYPALVFAALGGSTLGFLRYNFNPASVFMGDGGSYFLGYSIAGLSILSSSKAETGTALIIPILALGLPVFDALLSPVRRFIVGQRMFKADKDHIHHKLVEMGLSTKKVVYLFYIVSSVLCLLAIVVVNFQERRAGLFLLIVAFLALVFTRKLGYFEYLAFDKLGGWFKDLSDVSGISHDRRSFLKYQIDISRSKTIEELWANVCAALEFLKLDRASFCTHTADGECGGGNCCYSGPDRRAGNIFQENALKNQYWEMQLQDGERKIFCWGRGYYRREKDLEKETIFKVSLPLLNGSPETIRTLLLFKDIKKEPIDAFTLRRIAQLRETIAHTLDWLEREKKKDRSVGFVEAQSTKLKVQSR